MSKLSPVFVRNLVFGVEDGLVSTVGFLAGVSAGGLLKSDLILSGVVLIFVEAFSMGVGSFLSESSAEEMNGRSKAIDARSLKGGAVMFVSYVFAGFWILLPYLFAEGAVSIILSVLFAFLALSALGFVSARITGRPPAKRVVRMIVAGGLAIVLGTAVGMMFG